jgi:hypothetical protein
MTPAHTLAAQASLGIPLHLDKDFITRHSLEDFKLTMLWSTGLLMPGSKTYREKWKMG